MGRRSTTARQSGPGTGRASWAIAGAAWTAAAFLTASLMGCGRPAFPQDLFTVGVTGADYPFMLSQAPKSGGKRKSGGRPLHGESGTHTAMQQSSYSTGNTTVTVTHTESGRSELSASTKVAAQVQRRDSWVYFDRAIWSATDFSTYGASSSDRMLSLDASAHRKAGEQP
jgi:hypothetical protein